jgi:3-methyladenine DNA glycosylase/8-oxoguanine DNA glycosylase
MPTSFDFEPPASFSFLHTVRSHGWYDLAPFAFDEPTGELRYVCSAAGKAYAAVVTDRGGMLRVTTDDADPDPIRVIGHARHILRLDDDLEDFYNLAATHERLSWVSTANAGRLLRSSTVWEDLVKTICTTNCSWALTKKMVANLVERLGEPTASGKRAFPTAAAMAAVTVDVYRDEIRAGYRSPYFLELAEAVASGSIDPEGWLVTDLTTAELKKEMKKVKGVGDYAAENLLKLVGRYDGLALDSFLRSQYYKIHNNERVCKDARIERHYVKFGAWRGLAIWCDMTEKWH